MTEIPPIPRPDKRARSEPSGVCRVCGKVDRLTKEHLPPKGAFAGRDYRVAITAGVASLKGGAKPQFFQHGHHKTVLCHSCNVTTGALYGQEFAKWTRWGLGILEESRKEESSPVPAFIGYPARIAKQVISTMLASAGPEFGEKNPELRDFVLNKESKLDSLRLRTYLCGTSSGRFTGVTARLNTASHDIHVLIEFALQPFGYILSLSGEPQDPRPVDIGWFAALGYDDEVTVKLPEIPILPVHLALPEDYRSADEIRHDFIVNVLTSLGSGDPQTDAAKIIAGGDGPAFFLEHGGDWENLVELPDGLKR